MVLDVVASLLPSAAGIALSPFPIIAVILVVGGPRGRWAGPTFAAGWLVGLAALTALAVLLGEVIDQGESVTWASWARVLVGIALVALGLRTFSERPRGDEPATMPGWMSGLTDATPRKAATVGGSLAALNPKNIAFTLASASVIGQTEQAGAGVFVEAAVFVLLASTTVLGVVLVSSLGGDGGREALAAIQKWLLAHNEAIVCVVFLLIGVTVVGEGLTGLS